MDCLQISFVVLYDSQELDCVRSTLLKALRCILIEDGVYLCGIQKFVMGFNKRWRRQISILPVEPNLEQSRLTLILPIAYNLKSYGGTDAFNRTEPWEGTQRSSRAHVNFVNTTDVTLNY